MIKGLKGDATVPQRDPPWILTHVVNDRGGFGKGFAEALAKRWPGARQDYKAWHAHGWMEEVPFALGAVLMCDLKDGRYIAHMLAQHGYKTARNPIVLDYDALRSCLAKVRYEAIKLKASVHMPRIGSGLAGGNWNIISQIIKEELQGVQVYIYAP